MTYEGYEALTVNVVDGVATVTIANPPINLFDLNLYAEMARLSAELAVDRDVRVVVLRSANPEFFIAHFDVAAILTLPTDLPEATELNDFHAMCERFRTMPKATIAVIEGRVGGGGSELTLSCDMRFAALGRAVFNQPEVALGIIPGGTGTQRLGRLMGRSRALEAILSCDDVDAALAERWGWVNRALPDGELWPFVERLSRRIASFPPHAVAAAKASVLLAEKGVGADLLTEGALFTGTLKEPSARRAMEHFLAGGGQTREGELRLGALIEELGPA
jgi:enoyl-CoA hydratase/carnithine racemase